MSSPTTSPLKRALRAIDDLQARLREAERGHREPLAVIGIGCRLPGGVDGPEAFWDLLTDGVDAVREVPGDRWDADALYDPDPEAPGKAYTRWGGFIEKVDEFDPQLFGISPREARDMDPQQRLLLEVSWEALENAAVAPDRLEGSRTGMFIGVCSGDYQRLSPFTHDPCQINAYSASGIAHSVVSGRLAYTLGLQGPAISVDTACSSSLVAIHLACQSLRSRECRMALAGGVHLMLAPDNTILFCKSRMMSPTGRCHTFGAGADGFVLGEGCAVVVLKRLSDARADGDRILAVVRGSALNQDGASGGLTVPNGPAQEAVIRAALEDAGLEPGAIGYVEAHGTGTTLGDPIEVRALGSALGRGREKDRPLLIGSVKTNLGHLEAAAGVSGFVKAVLAVERGEIPPHLHAEALSPHLPWDELPVRVVRGRVDWPTDQPRIAGVSAFGFSGTNAHVIVEEPPAADEPVAHEDRPVHVLAFSGHTEKTVGEVAARYVRHLQGGEDAAVDVAHTSNAGRAHLSHRRAVVFRTGDELRERLAALASGAVAEGTHSGVLEGTDRPQVVFLFTGQGAQHPGMGRALYESQPAFRRTLERAANILEGELERPLLDVLFAEGDTLDQTAYTQPALFAFEYALAELWSSWGIRPAAVLGHSVGEYVAACLAGVFSFEDGLGLVAARGRLMQALPEGGVMLAVQTGEERAREVLAPFADRVSLAAVNAPTSLVVSGDGAAVAEIAARLEAEGVKTKPLAVSHAFHSPLMEPMREEFERLAAGITFAPPTLPLISNVTGAAFRAGETPDASYWARHVREPVRFLASLQWLSGKGYRLFLEIGPVPTLSGLGALCLPDSECRWLPSLRRDRDDWEALLSSLASLYVQGAPVDWQGFDRDHPRRRVALPTYPFDRRRYWFSEGAARAAARRPDPSAHPLLGRRLRSAVLDAAVFEQTVDATSPEFVQDHRVHGAVVFPATGYVEMILAAGRTVRGEASVLEDLTIREALVLPEDGSRVVQTVVSWDGKEHRVRVFSQDGGDEESWRLHAEARVARGSDRPLEARGLGEARERCPHAEDGASFYAALEERGLAFGERFRGVTRVWRGEREAVARVEAPASVEREASRYELHPALLDACVQALAGAVPGDDDHPVFMPIGVGEVRLLDRPSSPLVSHARIHSPGSDDAFTGEVHVYRESDGTPVARLTGIALKKADAEALARVGRAGGVERLLHELDWEPRPLGELEPVGSTRPLREVGETLGPRLPALVAEHGFEVFMELEPRIDAVVADFVVEALERLGWEGEVGEDEELPPLADRLGIAARHRRAFGRLLEVVKEQGRPRAPEGTGGATGRSADTGATMAALLERHPSFVAELTLVGRCGTRLAEVLRGDVDPLHLLFPDGSTEVAEDLYVRSPGARAYNALAQEVLSAILPTSGPVRILEIGGGTGGTTSRVLPHLPPDRTEYVFTDVSPLFVARAEERFREFPFLTARALDIEEDPEAQGVEPARFDVVVAANVLHATRDLRQTFRHVRQLLAPSGTLVLLEVTRPQGWVDVTFGLTDGWWRFTDTDLRPSYPLLSRAGWLRFLEQEAGFTEAVAIPGPSTDREPVQAILVARAPRTLDPVTLTEGADDWLILGDGRGVAPRLADRLEQQGARVTRVQAGTSSSGPQSGLACDPTRLDQVQGLVETVGSVTNVVHLMGLDAEPAATTCTRSLDDDQHRLCGSVLHLVKALATKAERPARLFLVTRGAQAVEGALASPAQSTLWGLGKVVALEHPEMGCKRIDLAPGGQGGELEALEAELLADDGEDQVALRPGGRYVPRLVSVGDRGRRAASTPICWELGIRSRGALDDLEIRASSRRRPGPGEIEIETRAIGLNFRDVLNALGLYPGTPPPFGSECAGRVTAIGPGVRDLKVGDDVIAVAPGALRSHLVASADFVTRMPPSLSYEEAATLAVPFVTAWFCLRHVGGLTRGETVLIHAAAGGVGLAAVQVARLVGAEVLGTAGSPEKRDFLTTCGVSHVMDSRSHQFVEGVRAATGGRGVDLVLNSLAADFVGASLGVTAHGGRFVEIGKRDIWEPERVERERPDVRYTVVDWGETAREAPGLIRGILREVMSGVADGTLHPLPRRVFDTTDLVEAFRFMAQGRHLGKIVITAPPAGSTVAIRGDRNYLVTGGLRGLGLLTANWLVTRGARHLTLIGRRGADEAAREAIGRMEASGARVSVFSADVADADRVAEVLGKVAAGPPLGGVVHAAGVLDDGVLTQLDWTRFARVLAPKVQGAWNLHALTREHSLDFFVLYSSVASLLGSPGQANHAAANAFLDALAHHRRSRGMPAVSLNWGAWREIGAAARLETEARAAQQGVGSLSPEEGLEALSRLLEPASPQMGVVALDGARLVQRQGGQVPRFLSRLPRPGPAGDGAGRPGSPDLRQRLAESGRGSREAVLGAHVRELAVQVLGLEESAGLDPRRPLQEMGLDSLMAVELRNVLGRAVGQTLPATLLFDHPTVEALVSYLAGDVLGLDGGESEEKAEEEVPGGVVDAIEDLSDDEVDRLLAERMERRGT